MFKRILIANRGEIACRIIRTAQRLGIHCIAVYSSADVNALHVKLADEAYCIGPAPSSESYLCIDKIVAVAKQSYAQAIHPGYGFLSENADFAEACLNADMVFIGPSASAIRAMGSKSEAKKIMEKASVALVPGYHADAQDILTLQAAADAIGYPILLKAAAGGGGKGMRIVWQRHELAEAVAATKREAKASFNNEHILLEKYLNNPRHIEMQIFADSQGNTIHLFERDCSIQRRHQKILEEAPAPGIDTELRKRIGTAAVTAAKAINYVGAGTIEFLLDSHGDFYFMEMNTRLQVEHPITEMITGLDLVEWQLKIAHGEPLPLMQDQLNIQGHAFEARIYAEDPTNDFLPATGEIIHLLTPAQTTHIRIDSGIQSGDIINPYYDPMLAKLIVWDSNRERALQRLVDALNEFAIIGTKTNIGILSVIASHPDYLAGKFDTCFIQTHLKDLLAPQKIDDETLALVTLYVLLQQKIKASKATQSILAASSPWHEADNWRLNLPHIQTLHFIVSGDKQTAYVTHQAKNYDITLNEKLFHVEGHLESSYKICAKINERSFKAHIFQNKTSLFVLNNGKRYEVNIVTTDTLYIQQPSEAKHHLTAPMPGKLIALFVKPGQVVEKSTRLAIIEAMKMEHTIYAPSRGRVKEWFFQVGDLVNEGVDLLGFEAY